MIYQCNITKSATAEKLKDALGKQGLTIDDAYWIGDVYHVKTETTFDQTAFENEFVGYNAETEVTKVESAKQKLQELGLTIEEIKEAFKI